MASLVRWARGSTGPRTSFLMLDGGFSRGSLLFLTFGAALAQTGCGPSAPPGLETTFTDSAGVVVAESSGFPEPGAGGWVLDQTPSLSIGTLHGDSTQQLFRVTGAVALSDGRLALSDNGSHQIRIFASDGTFQTSFGREGEGPGEFRNIRVMGTVGSDTLVVLDGRQRRTSRFHPDVGFLGQTLLPEEAGVAMHSNGMFGDGAIVFGGLVNGNRTGEPPSDGYERLTNPYYSVSLDGTGITHFGEFPGTEVMWMTREVDGESQLSAAFVHFGRSPRAFAGGDRLALGTRDRYEILVFESTGELVRIVRVRTPPVVVTEAHLDGDLEELISRLPDPGLAPGIRAGYADVPHAETMPAFENLFWDASGCLWVEDKYLPGDTTRIWTVFDREGVLVTRLSLPIANRVLDIGDDFVLTRFEDDLGVEYVRSYPLTRGPPPLR